MLLGGLGEVLNIFVDDRWGGIGDVWEVWWDVERCLDSVREGFERLKDL